MTRDELNNVIEDCERRSHLLTEWEAQFIDSLCHQLGDGKALTSKQAAKLEAIWDRVTE